MAIGVKTPRSRCSCRDKPFPDSHSAKKNDVSESKEKQLVDTYISYIDIYIQYYILFTKQEYVR